MNEDDPNLPPTSDSDRLGAGPSARSYSQSQSQSHSLPRSNSDPDPQVPVITRLSSTRMDPDPEHPPPHPSFSSSSSPASPPTSTTSPNVSPGISTSASATAISGLFGLGNRRGSRNTGEEVFWGSSPGSGLSGTATTTQTQTSNSNSMMGVSISPPAPPVGFNPPPASHPSSTGSSPGSPLNLNSNTIGPGSTTTTGRISSVSLGEASGGGEKMVGWPFGQSHSPSLLGQEEQVRFGSYHSGQREQTGGAAGANASASASASPSAGAAAGTGERTGGITAGSSASSSSGTSEGSGRNRTGLRGMVGTNEQGAVGSTGSGSGAGQGQGQGYAQGQGQGQGSGSGSGQGINRSGLSSPRSSVSSITLAGLARRTSGGRSDSSRSGSNRGSISNHGGPNPFDLAALGGGTEKITPPAEQITRSGMGMGMGAEGDELREAVAGVTGQGKSTASEQLDRARQNLNDEKDRVFGLSRQASLAGLVIQHPQASPMEYNAVAGKSVTSPSSPVLGARSPTGSLRRSSSDDGRSAGSRSPSRSSSSAASGSRLETLVSPGGVVAPSTLLGVDTITSPISYTDQSSEMFSPSHGRGSSSATTGDNASISSSRSGSSPIGQNRRGELGRWSTAREVRNSPPGKKLPSPAPSLQRSFSHESHRHERASTEGAQGNVHMWDSVWPTQTSNKAVDPVTALPVSHQVVGSPALVPLIPPLGMHSRSMSASVVVNSPNMGSPADSYNRARRDSGAGVFGRPAMNLGARPSTPGQLSPPGSPLSYINPQTRSLPMFRSAKKSATPSSGSATSKTSPTYTDRAESPLNSTDLPMFSAPRGPGSPRAIPTMMNRYFSETDVPGLIFTQPTPTPEVSLSRPSDDERTNTFDTADSLLASSPPLALPPALASPEPAPAAGPSTLAASPAISEKSSGSGTPVKAASVARPVPPPFRRALSHVNAASPPLQASTSPRPRAYSGSTSTMARPAMVSQNSGYSASRQRSGQASPLQQPRVVSPFEDSPPQSIGSDRGPSPTIRVSPDKEENDRSPPAKSPVAKSKSSSGGISGESISPPSIGNSSHLDADDEASPVLPDSAIMKDISIEPQSDVFDESFDAVQQDYNPPVIADTELHGSGTLNSDADEVMAVPTDTLPADVAFEDEGLLTLERIFLLSKSEHAFHRAYIARTLGDLLEDTDPCEAVEYVIPLLTGFALDEDESVKEAFASQLHKVLWYFFTSCDLIGEEDEILASEDPSKDPVFAITSEGVRALRRSDTALGAPGDIGPRLPGSGSGSSGSTSWNSSEGSSAGAASLKSRKESISSSTDMTTGTPASSIETPGSVITADTSQSVHAAAQRDKEMSKDLFQGTEEQPDLDAGPLLDRPIIPVHIFTPLIGSLLLSQNSLVADPARAAVVAVLGKLRKADIPILDEWPEERPEGVKLAYTAQSGSHSHDIPMFSVISRRMVQKELLEGIVIGIGRLHEDRAQSRKGSDGSSIIGAAPDQGDQTDSGLQRTVSRASGQPGTVSSDGADSEAAFLKQQLAQEAVLGRAISMNLIASISEFLQDHEIARYDLVTEVARTLEDEPGVKAEAALALAYLAKQAPQDHIEVMLSLFEHFVEDENEAVRQSACLCLPALSKRIENLEHRRSYTVRAFEALLDSGDLVEYTLLEIIGEIIHIFQDDPEGPPLELLEVFYSQAPVNQASSEDELIREFDNLDRAIVSAFNLPAVCLALGPERWAELRPTYKALCNINHQRIIASLAAAVHELAKILGPEISAYDLLPSFTEYIHGADEAKVKVLGGLPSFVSSLPVDEALAVIDELSAMWIGGSLPNWRHREALASHFAALLKHMASVGEASTALGLLNHGLADTFQAIREATITNMPSCYGSVKDDKTSSDQIMNMLKDLAISGNFKQRRTYIACVEAFVKQKCSSEFFEEHFLDDLAVLSDDLLDVRISVAKCLGPICARDGLYPHSPLRPLRLNEIVERLSNDDSQYVRDPIAKIVVRPRIRPGGPSGIWSNGPYVYTPGSTGSHPSRSSPPDRRSSSASLLIRADSDSTIRQGNFGYQDKEEVSSGTQSAPSEMMFVPWSSPDLGESLGRPISMQEAQRMLGVEAEPVKVGMKDPFSANFGRAVAKAQSLHNNDKMIKRF